MVRAKVNIETRNRTYKPGEIISEMLSDADIMFLKKYGFIEEEHDSSDIEGASTERIGFSEDIFGDFKAEGGYKEEAALKKLNKEELVEYAKSIGLTIASDMLKNDMVDSVLNYIEEKMEKEDDGI